MMTREEAEKELIAMLEEAEGGPSSLSLRIEERVLLFCLHI